MKKLVTLILAVLMTVFISLSVFAEERVWCHINFGHIEQFSLIRDSNTQEMLFPVADVMKIVGFTPQWDGNTKILKLTSDNAFVIMQINNRRVSIGQYEIGKERSQAYNYIDLPLAPRISNGKVYAPLDKMIKFMGGECYLNENGKYVINLKIGMGVKFRYDPNTQTLNIVGTGDIPEADMGRAPFFMAPVNMQKSDNRAYLNELALKQREELVFSSFGAYNIDIGSPFFEHPDTKGCVIKRVVIGEGITGIGENTFAYLPDLEEAVLPSTLRQIGQNAFRGCSKLKKVNIPVGLNTIDNYAFKSCVSLEGVNFATSASVALGIYTGAFADCTGLKAVAIPERASVGTGAFMYCTGIRSVVLQENVYLRYSVFRNCTAVENISINRNVIFSPEANGEYNQFLGCNNIKAINYAKEDKDKIAMYFMKIKAV